MWVKRVLVIAAALTAATALASCAVGPDFAPPSAPESERYTKEPLQTSTSSTPVANGAAQHFRTGRDVEGEWWRLYGSRKLNALIRRALDANPNLQSAMAALRVANENVYTQQGKFFPLIAANFNPSRQQQSTAITPIPSPIPPPNPFNLVTSQLTIAYTLDIWGQNQRAVESQQALADFQHFQVEAAYISLTSNVVVAAITEASLRAQITATEELITAARDILRAVREQFEHGGASRVEVALQEANLATLAATLPPLRKALAIQRNLLAALTGRPASEEPAETFRLADLHLPVDLPLSVPSQLIEQRPDVRAAEEQLHSASAQVGVAIANMLPNFTISGNRGYTALDFASLLSSANLFWTVAGNATQTVFDGFSLLHNKRAAEAVYDQAAWNYRTTVITALQNVADALRAIQNDADALQAARANERAWKLSFDLTLQQYRAGAVSIVVLLSAQQSYQTAVIALVQAQAMRLSDTAALYQALGGGWWNRPQPLEEKKFDVAKDAAVPVDWTLPCNPLAIPCIIK
jgi:NodT family efflux transporter outer membrane factor (OMF) lipoprotein